MRFFNHKKKDTLAKLVTHERYPEVLKWKIGDSLKCRIKLNWGSGIRDCHLEAINSDQTVVVSVDDFMFWKDGRHRIIPISKVVKNRSLRERVASANDDAIRKGIKENNYNSLLAEYQTQYQKLLLEGDSSSTL